MEQAMVKPPAEAAATATHRQPRGADEVIAKDWAERSQALEAVRLKLRSGWRNDDGVLEQYFQSCVQTWKLYTGPRPPKKVLKLQGVYKQALLGDCVDAPPPDLRSVEGVKWSAWNNLRGMDASTAKRRFITLLSEIDPLLIDVMPDEKPPAGFPMDRNGHPICAKCNTRVGCTRPLMDDRHRNLKQQLFGDDSLYDPIQLRVWLRAAMKTQRCVWGSHAAINSAQAKPFLAWFNRAENGGFLAYDSLAITQMLKDLLVFNCEVAYDMQLHPTEYHQDTIDQQAERLHALKNVYEEFAGTGFEYLVDCTRDVDMCNARRFADGGKNHSHPLEIELPKRFDDAATYAEAIELRDQCKRLGLSLTTGVVHDVKERCAIYRQRLEEHYEVMKKAAEAKKRNEERPETHAKEKKLVKALMGDMVVRQCWDACHNLAVDKVLTLVKRGARPNEESPRGLTPLLTMLIAEAQTEQIEALLKLKADINHVNRHGMTPLMLACRMKDTKLVHVLMRAEANVYTHAGSAGGGKGKRTAAHWCALHGSEEECRVLADYVKDSGGDSLRMQRFLDAQSDDGETALMLAAKRRQGAMCVTLIQMGANPSLRNRAGKNACFMAKEMGWREIGEWLEKKVGAGVANMQTYSDVQYDRKLRFGTMKMREHLEVFIKTYLQMVTASLGLAMVPIGPVSVSKHQTAEYGERAQRSLQDFVDAHQLNFHRRDKHDREVPMDLDDEILAQEAARQAELDAAFARHDEGRRGIPGHRDTASGAASVGTMTPASVSSFGSLAGPPPSLAGHVVIDETPEEEKRRKQALKRAEWRRTMQSTLAEMHELIKTGVGSPNSESAPKPLAWTPLMCAAAIDDVKWVRLLVREGADPNQQNRHGTTPLMLAAQLNNSAAMLELLGLGGLGDVLDSEGLDAQAYAGSLPPPSSMQTNLPALLTDGDTGGPRRLPASELLKTAREHGHAVAKEKFEKNMKMCTNQNVELHFKKTAILEHFGLTHVETQKHIKKLGETATWRLPPSADEQGRLMQRAAARDRLAQKKAADERAQAEAAEAARVAALVPVSRCPLCTLPPPCGHFYSKQMLDKFLGKLDAAAAEAGYQAQEEALRKAKTELLIGLGVSKVMEKKAAAADVDSHARVRVMRETHLNNRHTDRNLTMVREYRDREYAVRMERKLRLQIQAEEVQHRVFAPVYAPI